MRRYTPTIASSKGHVKVDLPGIYVVRFEGPSTPAITVGASSSQDSNWMLIFEDTLAGSGFKITSSSSKVQVEAHIFALADDYLGAKHITKLDVIGPIA